MKPLHLGMGVAVAVLAALVIFDRPESDSGIAEAVVRGATATSASPRSTDSGLPHIAILVPRDQLIGEPGEGADVFGSHNWNPPPPPPAPVQDLPPPAPVAPPLPFTVIGTFKERVETFGHWQGRRSSRTGSLPGARRQDTDRQDG